MEDKIKIKGARVHNLKNISLELPRNKLIVFTGISGSGKSSLAFDTIFAEGQRRYIESLSSYARQFLGQMEKPDVESIEGLSPAVSIDQKGVTKNPRSTIGTVTEIYDYLRVLFARIGIPYCPNCQKPIQKMSVDQMAEYIQSAINNQQSTKITILAPIVKGRKGEYHQFLQDLYSDGWSKVRIDGKIHKLSERIVLSRYKIHTIDLIIDELEKADRSRLTEAIEQALKLGEGFVKISTSPRLRGASSEFTLSTEMTCAQCGYAFSEISPRNFSFNSPYGACETCQGIGLKKEIDPDLVIPDKNLSISQGGMLPYSFNANYYNALIRSAADYYNIPIDKRIKDLRPDQLEILLYGAGHELIPVRYWASGRPRYFNIYWDGICGNLLKRWQESESEAVREEIEKYMSSSPCPVCKGKRLKKESLAIKVTDRSIAEISALSVKKAIEFFDQLKLTDRETKIAERLIKEIRSRLDFMKNVGLDYLTIDRPAATLAAGENQRIRLASQLGANLVGVLYVLDEPSIGLHQRDNRRLLQSLENLRDQGNTILVVEHDEETIWHSDWLVDIGPGAGRAGGKILFSGPLEKGLDDVKSLTFEYLRGEKKIEIPKECRKPKGDFIEIQKACEHNLQNINVKFPLGLFTCVTGVSGSGKSTLVDDILYRALARKFYKSFERPGRHQSITGAEKIDKVIDIDQSPIGRSPRSNPATYTGLFDEVRKVFSQTKDARVRGYLPGRFSFNVPGGRCESCRGDGQKKIEMHFLPDIYISCEVCNGSRYNQETLKVKYKEKNIADILAMTVDEALEFFSPNWHIADRLQTLVDVGLGYIQLGQPATTLSGGEAQRVKLATELARRATGKTLYILDEPTTGLHFHDIKHLLGVLQRLVNSGNTVIVIEHNLEVIKTADWLIDLGPEGGDEGGNVVCVGSPEEVAKYDESYTGQFLKKVLKK